MNPLRRLYHDTLMRIATERCVAALNAAQDNAHLDSLDDAADCAAGPEYVRMRARLRALGWEGDEINWLFAHHSDIEWFEDATDDELARMRLEVDA